jgi:molybdopterin converting factor small subunit
VAIVFIPSQLSKLTGGARRVEASGKTLRDVIDSLDRDHPGIRERLVEGNRLRPGLAAAVDNAFVGLLQPVEETSEIHFVPAMQGG